MLVGKSSLYAVRFLCVHILLCCITQRWDALLLREDLPVRFSFDSTVGVYRASLAHLKAYVHPHLFDDPLVPAGVVVGVNSNYFVEEHLLRAGFREHIPTHILSPDQIFYRPLKACLPAVRRVCFDLKEASNDSVRSRVRNRISDLL